MDSQNDDNKPQAETIPEHGSFRTGFAFSILSFLAMAIFGVVSAIVTSRLYGIRIIGQFALVSAPIGALWVLSTAKEQAALIKEITGLPRRHPRVTQLFAAVFTFSSSLTAVMSLLGAVASWFVFRGPLHHPELVAPTFASLAGYALVTNTGWNIDSVFSAFVAGRQLFWVRLHETLSFIVIATVIGAYWQSIWGLTIALTASSFTALLHRVIAVRPFIRMRLTWREYRIGLRELPGLLRFGLKITPGSVAQGISQQAGVWVIGALTPVKIVGAYSRAQTIPQRLQQVNVRIVEVLYPTLVGRKARGDGHGFDRALVDSIRYGMIGMLLIAASFGGAAHSVLEIFGPGFSRATTALVLLLLFPALASVTLSQTQALWAGERPGLTSFIAFARMAVTIGLTFALTPIVGINGPAIGLLAGFMVVIVWSTISLRPLMTQPYHKTWPLREQLALIAAYAAGFGGSHLVEHALPSRLGLLLALIAGTLAYVAAFAIGGGVNRRDRERISDVLANLRARRERRRQADSAQATGGLSRRPATSPASNLGRESLERLQLDAEPAE